MRRSRWRRSVRGGLRGGLRGGARGLCAPVRAAPIEGESETEKDDTDRAEAEPVVAMDATDPTVRAAWDSVRKQLISVGRAGVRQSHANSLAEALRAHSLVKVKLASDAMDAGRAAAELTALMKRAGGSSAYVGAKGQMLMFARDEGAVAAAAAGAASGGGGSSSARAPGARLRKSAPKLFMGGVPHDMTAEDVEALVRPHAGGPAAPLRIELPVARDGSGNKGHALLTVGSAEAAAAVTAALNGKAVGQERTLSVRPDGAKHKRR